jgi:tRNA pseudouridine38-40 synthase
VIDHQPARTLRLTIAYDGTGYAGWQRQTNGLSIQQLVEDALQTFCHAGAPRLSVHGASRTDAGVHALAQVASVRVPFDAPARAVWRALNVRLPLDVRVLAVEDAPHTFHARFDASGKRYRYRIFTASVLSPFVRAYVWHRPYPTDVEAMRQETTRLVGTHDFASFEARGAQTLDSIRTLERVDVEIAPDEIHVVVEGSGFLRHMVRIIVGSLVEVGAGRRPAGWVGEVLAARTRGAAGPTAPAAGLVLEHVRY